MSLITEDYKSEKKHKWVYDVINKSKATNDATKVVLVGDSVADQLYRHNKYNDEVNSFASSIVIGLVAQYFYLTDFLENNNPSDLVILCTNGYFKNNLHRPEVYHHFLKPFYISEYKDRISPKAEAYLDKIPWKNFSQLPHIKTSTWSPTIMVEYPEHKFMTDLSAEYLIKIYELCRKNEIELHILPTPINEKERRVINQFAEKEISLHLKDHPDLRKKMMDYVTSVSYLETRHFKDAIHLKKPQQFKRKYIQYTDKLLK